MIADNRLMTHSRRSGTLTGAIALTCLALAGCGSSTPAGPPQVTLLLTAPTSGATVGVQTIKVAGTVTPAGAVVRIAGKRVRVRQGGFLASVHLISRTTRIRIVARARGYAAARTETVVHFSSATAKGMLVARRDAVSTRPAAVAGSGSDLAPPLNTPAGRRHFMSNCVGGASDPGIQSACTCMYTHFLQSGDFNSRHREAVMLTQMMSAESSGNIKQIPISLRSTMVACAPKIFQAGG